MKRNTRDKNNSKWPSLTENVSPMPKDARHLHVVNCSQEGVLEFNSHMRQCFSKFLTVSKRAVGARGGIGWLVVLGLTAL